MIARLLRRLAVHRAALPRAFAPADPEFWAFDRRANTCDFNLVATVLPPLAGWNERKKPLIYLEVREPAGVNYLFLTRERARLMLNRLSAAGGWDSSPWRRIWVDDIRFDRSEFCAIQRVLSAALGQAKALS